MGAEGSGCRSTHTMNLLLGTTIERGAGGGGGRRRQVVAHLLLWRPGQSVRGKRDPLLVD